MQKTIRPKEIIRQRNRRLLAVTASILFASLAYIGYWWYLNGDWVTTDDAFVSGHLITVKAQTDGTIVEILAEDSQHVRRGQVVARLDGTRAKIALEEAQAELGETVRDIVALQARLETLEQRIVARQAALSRVRHDLSRFRAAALEGAISEQKVENARDQLRQLKAEIAAIRAEKTGIEAQVSAETVTTHPAVEKAKSRLRRAYLEYRRRHIVAPVSGYVAKRRAQIGDRVGADTPLLVIVPLQDLWIEANLLETKIARVRPGQDAEIIVDAYGDERIYHGIVEGLHPGTGSAFALLPTDNASGNFIHIAERLPVRIALDREELRQRPLQPGLSTLTRIHIAEPGQAMLESRVNTAAEAYRTDIYDHELDGVEQLIDNIVAANKTNAYVNDEI